MLKRKANKPPVSEYKTGRPPKNMCKPCKGWGQLWSVLTKVYYYGSGEEAVNLSKEQEGLVAEECADCKGTGYKGGRLRSEVPPILGRQTASDGSLKDHVIKNGDIASSPVFRVEEEEHQAEVRAKAKLESEGGMVI